MVKTTHVRAALHQVLAVLDSTVGGEGFRRSEMTLAPRVITVGAETMTLPPEVPAQARRIVVAERAGWVSIADEAGAMTDWGAAISTSLTDVPVVTLEGECDHAFYSRIVVHEGGAIAHRSDVPGDAVHEADGRYRIRPTFLATYFPDARRALDDGIVVNRLGGEENVRAVGEALSIPNALLTAYDAEEEGRVAHLFEYDAELAGEQQTHGEGASPFAGELAAMLGQLTASLAGQMDPDILGAAEAPDPQELAKLLMAGFGKTLAGEPAEQPLTLAAPLSSQWSGFVKDDHEGHTRFTLDGGTADGPRSARGLTLRITGGGLSCIDIDRVRVMPTSSVGNPDAPAWQVVPARDGEAMVAHVPDLELTLPPPRADDALPGAERMRRGLHRSVVSAMASNRAEAVVYLSGKLVRAGKGAIAIQAEMTTPDGAVLTAVSKSSIEVKPALRAPVLPEWADARARADRHYGEQYEGREVAIAWLAFDRAWLDVRDVVTGMVVDLGARLSQIAGAEPVRARVELDEHANTDEILAALKRGADVVIRGRTTMRATLEERPDGECVTMREEEPAADGFGAEVLRKGGERIRFPAPLAIAPSAPSTSAWARVLAELERGANVSLESGGPDTPLRIEITHQPEGSNYFPDPENARRHPRVELTWSCPRPTLATSCRALAEIATDLLTRAGTIEGNLGGVSFAAGAMTARGSGETPYEHLVGTHRVARERAWLETHVRCPGHRVLVPSGASAKVGATPGEITRTDLPFAVLLSSAAPDPFEGSREDMERAVLSLVGPP